MHREKIPLAPDLEQELAAIRADPGDAIGFGEKSYLPYELRQGEGLAARQEPAVTRRLLAEVLDDASPHAYRLALLHVLSRRADAGVDAALIEALTDAKLRAMAAYALGRAGFKGYPQRPRDRSRCLAALRPYLDDMTPFLDPWYQETWNTQDFVIAAFVRIAGPEHFPLDTAANDELIGYDLPRWSDAVRTRLLAQCEAAR